MVSLNPPIHDELIGEEIVCPVCREEPVLVDETRKGALMVYADCQRSPLFINRPQDLPGELIPDDLTDDQEGTQVEQPQDDEYEIGIEDLNRMAKEAKSESDSDSEQVL